MNNFPTPNVHSNYQIKFVTERGTWSEEMVIVTFDVEQSIRILLDILKQNDSRVGMVRPYRDKEFYLSKGFDDEVAKLNSRLWNQEAKPLAKIHKDDRLGWFYYEFTEGEEEETPKRIFL